ncbi:MAG: phosphoribosylamine--glycine ligase [bacterium]|nr:phosphoribosylamine--glycine ligase [bacterium]
MDILVVGSGGREHALVWKLSQSPKVKNIYVAPGNAGTASIAKNIPPAKTNEIITWLKRNKVDLVVIGPDNYLAEGIVDKIQNLKILVFGPTKSAAKIEWSKSFAKKFMLEENIPTALFKYFTDFSKAKKYIKHQIFPLVIKVDGLALGKGVRIVKNLKEGIQALEDMMRLKIFGTAGNTVIIEEFLIGKEISIHVFCDGETFYIFPTSKDHKRAFDNNLGPNTGGMGTIAPVPGINPKVLKEIERKIILPTLNGLSKRGSPFSGILYPGIMLTKNGPKVIEFNARFGDPETQSYMRILKTDLADILMACAKGNLREVKVKWNQDYACCIVLASEGYPSAYKKGGIIKGIKTAENMKDIVVFHAGTKQSGDNIVTNGGRVLGVTVVATSLPRTLKKAYTAIKSIKFSGKQFRKDIGKN